MRCFPLPFAVLTLVLSSCGSTDLQPPDVIAKHGIGPGTSPTEAKAAASGFEATDGERGSVDCGEQSVGPPTCIIHGGPSAGIYKVEIDYEGGRAYKYYIQYDGDTSERLSWDEWLQQGQSKWGEPREVFKPTSPPEGDGFYDAWQATLARHLSSEWVVLPATEQRCAVWGKDDVKGALMCLSKQCLSFMGRDPTCRTEMQVQFIDQTSREKPAPLLPPKVNTGL